MPRDSWYEPDYFDDEITSEQEHDLEDDYPSDWECDQASAEYFGV